MASGGSSEVESDYESCPESHEELPRTKPPSQGYKSVSVRLEEALLENGKLQRENEQLRHQVGEWDKLMEEVKILRQASIKQKNTQLSSLENKLQELEKIRQDRQKAEEDKQRLETEFKSTRDKLEDQLRSLQGDFTIKEREMSYKSEMLTELDKKCQQIRSELENNEQEKLAIKNKLDCTTQELSSTQQHLEETRERLTSTVGELGETKERLTSTVGELVNTKDSLTERLRELDIAEDMYKERECQYSQELGRVEGERNELNTRVISLEGSCTTLQLDKERLTRELSDSQSQCDTLTTKLASVSSVLDVAQERGKDATKLKNSLEGVSAERDEYRKQRDVARNSLIQRNEELAVSRQTVTELKGALEGEAAVRMRLSADVTRLREELNIANTERMRIERELDSITTNHQLQGGQFGPVGGGNPYYPN